MATDPHTGTPPPFPPLLLRPGAADPSGPGATPVQPQPSEALKSLEFRRERERTWQELESLIDRARGGRIRTLSTADLLRLPRVYRATLSSLSVARSISLDANLIRYLESLCARAYFCVYGSRGSVTDGIAGFFRFGFPGVVREARWHVLVAGLTMLFGAIVGFSMTSADSEWFYAFVPAALGGDRSPASTTEALRAALYGGGEFSEMLSAFASFLFAHNARIGLLCFALGFALGVPVFFLMFTNGLTLGAFVALYYSRGLTLELLAWLSIHGTTELLAVILCGAAGLMLGQAVVFPGPRDRLTAFAETGRRAARIAIGAVALFFCAGLLEGFGRQMIQDPAWRAGIGLGLLAAWIAYFTRCGRGVRDG